MGTRVGLPLRIDPEARSRRRADAVTIALVMAITALGAWLRAEGLSALPLWLDEILNVPIAREASSRAWWEWLVGFERENGPLYYALARLGMATRLPLELGFRLLPLLAGIAAIPLIAAVSWRATRSRAAATLAAAFVAISPLHVVYSREGRPYAVLVVCVLVAICGLLGRPRPIVVVLALFAAAMTAATAVPMILATIATSLLLSVDRSERRGDLVSAAGGAAALAWSASYLRFAQGVAAPFEDRAIEIGAMILNSFVVTSGRSTMLAPAAVVAVLFALAGFAMLRDRRSALVLGSMTVAPVLAMIAALALSDHWYSVRYTIHGLPPFLILVAAGMVESFSLARRAPRGRSAATALAAIAVAGAGWLIGAAGAHALDERFDRADWRRVAIILASHASKNDLVIASTEWAAVSLRFHLNEIGHPLDVRSVDGSVETARGLLERRPYAWVVSGGWDERPEFRRWACGFFSLFASPAEAVRLSFAPDLAAYVRWVATDAERERFFDSFTRSHGGTIHLGLAGTMAGDGFHGAENVPYRWAGRSVVLHVPVPAGAETVLVRMAPFFEAGKSQRVTVTAGAMAPLEWELEEGPATYALALAPSDEDRIVPVRMEFAWEISPAELRVSSDSRRLSAAMDWVAVVDDPVSRDSAFPVLLLVSEAEPVFGGDGDTAPIAWSARGLSEFQSRLGLPAEVRPRIPAEVATSLLAVLPPRECVSDEVFLETTYRTLLGRRPDRVGRAFYLGRLGSGGSRHDVVRRIAEGEGFGGDRWAAGVAGER